MVKEDEEDEKKEEANRAFTNYYTQYWTIILLIYIKFNILLLINNSFIINVIYIYYNYY